MLTENETRSLIEFINKFFGLDLSENLKPIAISELSRFKKINKIIDLADFLNNILIICAIVKSLIYSKFS